MQITDSALFADMYAYTSAYAWWLDGKHEERAAFEWFFRKNPFGLEYSVSAGIEEVLAFLDKLPISDDDLDYIRTEVLPDAEPGFFEWLRKQDGSEIALYALREGTLTFPRLPGGRAEGGLALLEILEGRVLNSTNFPSLVTTNATRYRLAAPNKLLLEMGLRRAQEFGALRSSKYIYMGGFDGTSNLLAGKTYGIPVRGTMMHAFVQSYGSEDLTRRRTIKGPNGAEHDFTELVLGIRKWLGLENTNDGELASFISYAVAHPRRFLALVDTYDTLLSGVPNYVCVALALLRIGYRAVGIRLDSGDLPYLSKEARFLILKLARELEFSEIMGSNDIDLEVIHAFDRQDNFMTGYGIGTNVATCEEQPAFGGVYKLIELNGLPKIKLSQVLAKTTIPCRKQPYRLYGRDGMPIADLITLATEPAPKVGERVLCRDPYVEAHRVYVTPARVEPLLEKVWEGKRLAPASDIRQSREHVLTQLRNMRPDHVRTLNPTPYKVSLSEPLYSHFHAEWLTESPIGELS